MCPTKKPHTIKTWRLQRRQQDCLLGTATADQCPKTSIAEEKPIFGFDDAQAHLGPSCIQASSRSFRTTGTAAAIDTHVLRLNQLFAYVVARIVPGAPTAQVSRKITSRIVPVVIGPFGRRD